MYIELMIYQLKTLAKKLGLNYETLRKRAQRQQFRAIKQKNKWMVDEETKHYLEELSKEKK